MRTLSGIGVFILMLALLLPRTSPAQGFINLNFERAVIHTNIGGASLSTATVLGWSVNTVNYINGDTNSIPCNTIALDEPSVNLEGTNNPYGLSAIQGSYSIYLQGGSVFIQDNTNGASIYQTAQIPTAAQSISYWGGPLLVTFNGQILPFASISNPANYTVWVANISPYAGQTGQLTFTTPWQTSALLDNIQFSTLPVPEPSTLCLITSTGLFLAWHHLNLKPHKIEL